MVSISEFLSAKSAKYLSSFWTNWERDAGTCCSIKHCGFDDAWFRNEITSCHVSFKFKIWSVEDIAQNSGDYKSSNDSKGSAASLDSSLFDVKECYKTLIGIVPLFLNKYCYIFSMIVDSSCQNQ